MLAREPGGGRLRLVLRTGWKRQVRRMCAAVGLTVVRLVRRDGARLQVRGVDMLDGTPILDIKPYLSNVPETELRRGWLAEAEARAAERETAV